MQLMGSLFMVISVVLGALASHALERIISMEAIRSFEVGVRYMLYHGLALLILSMINYPSKVHQKRVFFLIVLGVLLFSGSIFLLSLKAVIPFSVQFVGPVTPVGGICLIIAWLLNIQAIRSIKK